MAPNPRVLEAFRAMKNLGISPETVSPVLKNLLKLYNKNWELIEEDNYRTLADAIFEYADDKKRQDNEKDAMEYDVSEPPLKKIHLEPQEDQASSEPPLKKIHLEPQEDQASSTANSGNTVLVLEANGMPLTSIAPKLMESSQAHSKDKKTESSSHSRHSAFRNKGKDPISSSGLTQVTKSSSERASSAFHSNQGSDGIGFDHMLREKKHKDCLGNGFVVPKRKQTVHDVPHLALPSSVVQSGNPEGSHSLGVSLQQPTSRDRKRPFCKMHADITKGTEKVRISLLDESGKEQLPNFNYLPENTVYQNAYIHFALARIADTDCCSSCLGDCLSLPVPCECAGDTGGEFAYTSEGLLREEFLNKCISMNEAPREHYQVYCIDCPLERAKNEHMPAKCKGHLVRKFIKECWRKCGCDMLCGNRVVQRGISRELQVFLTNEGKGWGLRSLQDLPKGAFVCEYVGEILTNMELYERNQQSSGSERHTYPVILDADWASEGLLKDEEALCLDATFNGNVARFINHRCSDANLLEIPVEVETPDRHYYHLAFFTKRKVDALEELTWDYGIDFYDHNHPIKAFQCCCGSGLCRGVRKMN
ncbi:histone-lysine N-methyltransferase SUVR4-like isoform X1 [Rhododendron vialii]|uniref:histone-lysine N-methyltransferase SUVR4-like isoform X1 n=2 Tax=Rhododendron vialii TaxID=182163 RepID=UPI00265EEBB3|nr:histone-lysine N-methyltransferase SUVR4-like isoform X1 [Rhododendron vialii]